MDADSYRAERCDLCGCETAEMLVRVPTGRSLRSDRRIVAGDLLKLRCPRCGLVREGHSQPSALLLDCYTNDYQTAPGDYVFHTLDGPVPRSVLFRDWLATAFGPERWTGVRRCLEVGAGSGALLSEMQRSWPGCQFVGAELCTAQAELARERGCQMHSGPLSELAEEQFDAIYTIAVLEHVPSPLRFLRQLRACLRPGGLLFLCQPTQDVPSYDLFFVDHLHHFGTAHLRHYAAQAGFAERGCVVGHRWMPNFSLHLWEACASLTEVAWQGPPAATACAVVAEQVLADMHRLDRTLEHLAAARHRVAVLGLNEVYALAGAYSQLGQFPLACGLDDRPDHPDVAELGFPVVAVEACATQGIEDVILAVNKVYHAQLRRRLARFAVAIHPVLN